MPRKKKKAAKISLKKSINHNLVQGRYFFLWTLATTFQLTKSQEDVLMILLMRFFWERKIFEVLYSLPYNSVASNNSIPKTSKLRGFSRDNIRVDHAFKAPVEATVPLRTNGILNLTPENFKFVNPQIIDRETFHRLIGDDTLINRELKVYNSEWGTDNFKDIGGSNLNLVTNQNLSVDDYLKHDKEQFLNKEEKIDPYKYYAKKFDWSFYKRQMKRARKGLLGYQTEITTRYITPGNSPIWEMHPLESEGASKEKDKTNDKSKSKNKHSHTNMWHLPFLAIHIKDLIAVIQNQSGPSFSCHLSILRSIKIPSETINYQQRDEAIFDDYQEIKRKNPAENDEELAKRIFKTHKGELTGVESENTIRKLINEEKKAAIIEHFCNAIKLKIFDHLVEKGVWQGNFNFDFSNSQDESIKQFREFVRDVRFDTRKVEEVDDFLNELNSDFYNEHSGCSQKLCTMCVSEAFKGFPKEVVHELLHKLKTLYHSSSKKILKMLESSEDAKIILTSINFRN